MGPTNTVDRISTKNNWLAWADGVRGLAALSVVFQHLVNTFYPYMNYVRLQDGQDGFTWVTWPIFRAMYSGTFSVQVFFVLSGMVLSVRFIQQISLDKQVMSVRDSFVRRLPRLLVPTVIVSFFSYLLFIFGGYNNSAGHHFIKLMVLDNGFLSFWQFIQQSLVSVWADAGGNSYVPITWTISYEVTGSFAVFLFLLASCYTRKMFRVLAQVFLIITFMFAASYTHSTFIYYSEFFKGILLAEIITFIQDWKPSIIRQVLGVLFFVAGLLFGSYPIVFEQDEWFWTNLKLVSDMWKLDEKLWYWLGSLFLLYGIGLSSWLQYFFASRIPVYLGKISFPLYLIHLQVIASLGMTVFKIVQDQFAYDYAVGITVAVVLATSFLLSHIGIKYIDGQGTRMGRWLVECVTDKKQVVLLLLPC